MILSRASCAVAACFVLSIGATASSAFAESVLRVAMTAADIPDYTGAPDQGYEGYRFAGYTLYDALALWDLSSSDQGRRHHAGPRDELDGRSRRQQALDLQAAPGRDLP